MGHINALRLELRTRNNRLWHFIFDNWPSVAEFCRHHGLDQGTVGDFLNLSRSPYSSKGVSPTAQKIADIAQMLVDELYPRELYAGLIPLRLVSEIPSENLLRLSAAKQLALPPSQQDEFDREELRTSISSVLNTLNPREAEILKLRFGIDGDEHTLEQIAVMQHVSRERIRIIERDALRKLRHPLRARRLKPFIETVPEHVV